MKKTKTKAPDFEAVAAGREPAFNRPDGAGVECIRETFAQIFGRLFCPFQSPVAGPDH
jgi:hypothetical protein